MDIMSMTTHVGGEFRRAHNNRSNPPLHCKPEMQKYNFIREVEPEEAYKRLYGKELEAYNAGKRPCRQIGDLYKHLKQIYDDAEARDKAISANCRKYRNKQKSPVKEMIVQLGGTDDIHNMELEKTVLIEFAKDFRRRNPNLYTIGVYIHMDEATPHMHLDFIYKAKMPDGLFQKLSFETALKEMGYEGGCDAITNKRITPFEQWQQAERTSLQEIALKHGIDTREGVMAEKRKHLEKGQYIIKREEERIEQMQTVIKEVKDENFKKLADTLKKVPGSIKTINRAVKLAIGEEASPERNLSRERTRSR